MLSFEEWWEVQRTQRLVTVYLLRVAGGAVAEGAPGGWCTARKAWFALGRLRLGLWSATALALRALSRWGGRRGQLRLTESGESTAPDRQARAGEAAAA